MKKGRFIVALALVLGILVGVTSGVFMYAYSRQRVETSLTVTFDGKNVDYTVQAWYQVDSDSPVSGDKKEFVTSTGATGGLSFSASDPSDNKVLKVRDSESPITLSATNNYVLFTYKFHNTASSGAYPMLVSLTGSEASVGSNMSVKYLVSDSDYTPTALADLYKTVIESSSPEFTDISINAGQTKFFYILVYFVNIEYNGTYNKSSSGFSWTVRCGTPSPLQSPSPSSYSIFETEETKFGTRITRLKDGASIPSTLEIPEGIAIIGRGVFAGGTMTSVSLPSTLTYIEEGAFAECNGLTRVDIPSSVTDIEDNAFSYCGNLTEIYFAHEDISKLNLGGEVFVSNLAETVYIKDKDSERYEKWVESNAGCFSNNSTFCTYSDTY